MSVKRIGKKSRRSRKLGGDDSESEIPMTPMIDVVFLLLIYFVMTMQPPDVFAHLDVFTPSPDAPPPQEQPEEPPEVVRVSIYPDGLQFDGVTVTEAQLENFLSRIGRINPNTTVTIIASEGSAHGDLIRVLNLCARHRLTNLSVMSGN